MKNKKHSQSKSSKKAALEKVEKAEASKLLKIGGRGKLASAESEKFESLSGAKESRSAAIKSSAGAEKFSEPAMNGKSKVGTNKRAKLEAKKNLKLRVNTNSESLSEQTEIWPNERNVLFKPERLRYVRKMEKPKGCVFCHAVEAGVGPKSLLLYKGKNAIVILNKYPYNNGHTLVLPRRHCGEFLELTDEEQLEINRCLKQLIHALQETYSPAGFNVGLNLGAAAGAGIPEHLHYHVIPRWRGDTNFFPLIAETKVVVETLEQTFERLVPYFGGKFKKGKA